MNRKSVPINTTRRLWSQCGGYCQNPSCNRPLFRSVGNDDVSIANVAHIIGHGSHGPRRNHELAEYIERDGVDNLIMLCLDCHKVIDELEQKFSVEVITQWKTDHVGRVAGLFSIANISDERHLLIEVNELLDKNHSVFRECGPFSDSVLFGESGDGLKQWRRRCLDTILPNNQRIVALIENNKRNFSYPWDVYQEMLIYKIHVDAFQDNCLAEKKINDYKIFPQTFPFFVKTKLGIPVPAPKVVSGQELEFRRSQIQTYIDRFLGNHGFIKSLTELNRGTMLIETVDGQSLKVFVTNTYLFSDYSLDRVLEVDPAVDAIICSCPAGGYSDSAKAACIEKGIGLFMLAEFMGAIRFKGDKYLNFLVGSEKNDRIYAIGCIAKECSPPTGLKVHVFGSFLRQKLYGDVDVMVVYDEPADHGQLKSFEERLQKRISARFGQADITLISSREFPGIQFRHNNLEQIHPWRHQR